MKFEFEFTQNKNKLEMIELDLIKKLKQGDKVMCTDSIGDKFIKGNEYEFVEIDGDKIIIKYIKYKKKKNANPSSKNIKQLDPFVEIKVNVKYRMSFNTFVKYFDIYQTIKPEIDDGFDWDWEE